MMGEEAAAPLWVPGEAARRSQLAAFAESVRRTYGVSVEDYRDLWRWSVEHLEQFWRHLWNWSDLACGPAPDEALTTLVMPGAHWFPQGRINFTQEVFHRRPGDQVALIEVTEDGGSASVTWAELERRTAALAAALARSGVSVGDRVAGYLPNTAAAVVGLLAAASLGAVWSACGPDYAASAAATRLAQLKPSLLIAADGYRYNGRVHDRRDQAVALAALLPTVNRVITVAHLGLDPIEFDRPVERWEDILAGEAAPLAPIPLPFEHPLWVLYSSGTTGVPKGLVHGHGGVVLEYHKVMRLHLDLGAEDCLFWYTTTNWMMWNFAVSALLVGARVLLYDGAATAPGADRLWALCADHGVSVLGTSPGYLRASEQAGLHPAREHDLSRLRAVGSTGSPLSPDSFHWLAAELGPDVPLLSVSGGTDVVTALALGAPTVPVWAGELSCPGLGVALDAFDPAGRPVVGQVGELVVTKPLPTMPVYLWDDPDGRRYHDAYFDVYPGVWRHGDWITRTDRGTIVIHGRSDATLNRHGVRLGSAEIYQVVDAVPGIRESLVVGLDLPNGGYWMPLFVVLEDGVVLDEGLRRTIKDRLRTQVSPRHVPDDVLAVPAIPHTRTAKKLEIPIKRILAGAAPADVLSLDAVDDPAALDAFVAIGAARRPHLA